MRRRRLRYQRLKSFRRRGVMTMKMVITRKRRKDLRRWYRNRRRRISRKPRQTARSGQVLLDNGKVKLKINQEDVRRKICRPG